MEKDQIFLTQKKIHVWPERQRLDVLSTWGMSVLTIFQKRVSVLYVPSLSHTVVHKLTHTVEALYVLGSLCLEFVKIK